MKNYFYTLLITFSAFTCTAQSKKTAVSNMPPLYFQFFNEKYSIADNAAWPKSADTLTVLKRQALQQTAKKWNIELLESAIVSNEYRYDDIAYRAGRPSPDFYDGVHPDAEHKQYQEKFGEGYLQKFNKEVQEEWAKGVIGFFVNEASKNPMFGNGLTPIIKKPVDARDALAKGLGANEIKKSKYLYAMPVEIHSQKHNAIFFKTYTRENEENTANYYIGLYWPGGSNYSFRVYDWFYTR